MSDTSNQYLAHQTSAVYPIFEAGLPSAYPDIPEAVRYGRILSFEPAPLPIAPSDPVGNQPSKKREKKPLKKRDKGGNEPLEGRGKGGNGELEGRDGAGGGLSAEEYELVFGDVEIAGVSDGWSWNEEEEEEEEEGGEGEGEDGGSWVGKLGEQLEWEQSEDGVEYDRIVKGGGFGGKRSIFKGDRTWGSLRHSEWLGKEIELMLGRGEIDRGEAARLRKRFEDMGHCGERVAVRQCKCCEHLRMGSGTYGGVHRTCKVRICPACGWVRSRGAGEYFEGLARFVDGGGLEAIGYRWQFLTVTTIYRPDLEEDLSRPALRKRVFLLRKFIRELWDKVLNDGLGAGLKRAFESSPRGEVHAHLLYYGPLVDMGAVAALTKTIGRGVIGSTDWREINNDCNQLPGEAGRDERAAAIGRVARYMMKGTSYYGTQIDEGLEAGEEPGWTMDPRLAARWESALSGLDVTQTYGMFRKFKPESAYYHKEPDDSDVACEECGTVGEWKTTYVNAGNWMHHCHEHGQKAMMGSNWLAWWFRAKLKGKWKPPPKEEAG